MIMIKPSRYDNDGYPITWYRSVIPSNTLAALYGLGRDCARRKVLGEDVEIILQTMMTNRRSVAADHCCIRQGGGKALVSVGVQSTNFPCRRYREAVSGRNFMLAVSTYRAISMRWNFRRRSWQRRGISLYAGSRRRSSEGCATPAAPEANLNSSPTTTGRTKPCFRHPNYDRRSNVQA
jgi:hypothetical protein